MKYPIPGPTYVLHTFAYNLCSLLLITNLLSSMHPQVLDLMGLQFPATGSHSRS